MTHVHAPKTDTPPECWEKAFEEPEQEVYWYCLVDNRVPVVKLISANGYYLHVSSSDAIDFTDEHRPGGRSGAPIATTISEFQAKYRQKGCCVIVRDVDGWFVLKEYPV